jgi:hypothetical protein
MDCLFIQSFYPDLSIGNKFFLVDQRTFPCDQLEIFMEGSKIIKTAFITKLFNAHATFDKQFAGMTHAYLDQKL